MEPVITAEGFKVLQNPDESRSLLGAYYETIGFHVIKAHQAAEAGVSNNGRLNNAPALSAAKPAEKAE